MKWFLGIYYINRVFIENICNSMMVVFMNYVKYIYSIFTIVVYYII